MKTTALLLAVMLADVVPSCGTRHRPDPAPIQPAAPADASAPAAAPAPAAR